MLLLYVTFPFQNFQIICTSKYFFKSQSAISIFKVFVWIWCLSCVLPQIKYAGSDTDFSSSPAFCKQIRKLESEEPRVIGTQTPLPELLEGLIADKELPAKDKKKRLKQVSIISALCHRAQPPLRDETGGSLNALSVSVPEIVPGGLPAAFPHPREQSRRRAGEKLSLQTSSQVVHLQEAFAALSEELELQSLTCKHPHAIRGHRVSVTVAANCRQLELMCDTEF